MISQNPTNKHTINKMLPLEDLNLQIRVDMNKPILGCQYGNKIG